MAAKEVLVECDVFEGMFSDEAVVEVADFSYVVPKSNVQGNPGQRGRVKARLVTRSDGEWVVLPTNYADTISAKGLSIQPTSFRPFSTAIMKPANAVTPTRAASTRTRAG